MVASDGRVRSYTRPRFMASSPDPFPRAGQPTKCGQYVNMLSVHGRYVGDVHVPRIPEMEEG
jgi:hypothetical protein